MSNHLSYSADFVDSNAWGSIPSRNNDWEPLPKTASQTDDITAHLPPLFTEGNQQSQAESAISQLSALRL